VEWTAHMLKFWLLAQFVMIPKLFLRLCWAVSAAACGSSSAYTGPSSFAPSSGRHMKVPPRSSFKPTAAAAALCRRQGCA
jgi:hypothetical protein